VGHLILIEGATRSTAYVLAETNSVEVFFGSSPLMPNWLSTDRSGDANWRDIGVRGVIW
jgi:hypothetical protein